MRYLKDYKGYMESLVINLATALDLMESLNIWHDTLLDAIGAQKVDIFDVLSLSKDDYRNDKLDLDYLCGGGEKDPDERFVNSLSSIKMKKSEVQNTEDYETFLNKPCKFMFIYGAESNELENPIYLMFQVWNETADEWSPAALYKVNGDAKKFYDKLSSKTIEIIDGDENYIYTTSNGNEWTLKNPNKENDFWKKVLRKEDLQAVVNDRNVSITII
jgi:hypothetical protein